MFQFDLWDTLEHGFYKIYEFMIKLVCIQYTYASRGMHASMLRKM